MSGGGGKQGKTSTPSAVVGLKRLAAGMAGGWFQAGLLTPWDRALYLAVKHHRPFFSSTNWVNPYQGVFQTLFQRAISSGIYFPLEDSFNQPVHDWLGETKNKTTKCSIIVGAIAGFSTGLIINPLSVIKYHTWGRPQDGHFFRSVTRLHSKGGGRIFLKGTAAGIIREVTWGSIFCVLRTEGRRRADGSGMLTQLSADFVAGCIATTASSLPNYVRNKQMAARSHERVQTGYEITSELVRDVKSQKTLGEKVQFLGMRLRVGWGSLRVAVGMAISNQVYAWVKEVL